MLLQNSLPDFYFLKHCHCQSLSSGGRRRAAKEQLAVNYSLPNHLHLISGTGKTGTRPTSVGNGDGGAEQSLAARDISLPKLVGHVADITGFKTQTRSSNGPWFCTGRDPEPLRPESITQEARMGCTLSRCVEFPPESVPALSSACWVTRKRKAVDLYRTACQAFLFLKEKILNVGIWFDEKE